MTTESVSSKEEQKLWRVRHSAAHVMAHAVLELFPFAKFAIGPPIANGFYYDFELPRPLSTEDLGAIEARMTALVKKNRPFVRSTMEIEEAIAFFTEKKQAYKVELIRELAEKGETEVIFYEVDGFVDLCAGPHVHRTKQAKAFKLLSVAGAYWRGDSKRKMLQRIYGTAWANKTDLKNHLLFLDEAKRRDHRKVGKELDLFCFHKESPGAIFWHPKGWTIYRMIQEMSREAHAEEDYVEISNPLIYNKSLYETSGHWDHYNEHMFKVETEGQTFCLKPMNCPDTMLFYKTKKRSYRELPLRVYEAQTLHRNELSGTLNGMLRVRQFAQDDAHIFVSKDQIEEEILSIIRLINKIYGTFQLTEYRPKLSTRPENFMGGSELWDEAEAALKQALEKSGLPYTIKEGDGAFYGPKIDFDVVDALGRTWQCATIQLDFQLPRRFELGYVDSQNQKQMPIVIHRAIFGSFERFLAILIEHLAGVFPTWMAPQQVVFLPVNEQAASQCYEASKKLRRKHIRSQVDNRNEKLGYRIREAELAKIPYMLVVGPREIASNSFALRTFQKGNCGTINYETLEQTLLSLVQNRTFDVTLQDITTR